MYYAKTAEPIKMLFKGMTLVGSRNHALHGGQDWMKPFAAARGNESAMQLFAKLLWTLFNGSSYPSVFQITLTI